MSETKIVTSGGAARRAARIANWAAELVAESDPKFKKVLAATGMLVVEQNDGNWSATSPTAPWRV